MLTHQPDLFSSRYSGHHIKTRRDYPIRTDICPPIHPVKSICRGTQVIIVLKINPVMNSADRWPRRQGRSLNGYIIKRAGAPWMKWYTNSPVLEHLLAGGGGPEFEYGQNRYLFVLVYLGRGERERQSVGIATPGKIGELRQYHSEPNAFVSKRLS